MVGYMMMEILASRYIITLYTTTTTTLSSEYIKLMVFKVELNIFLIQTSAGPIGSEVPLYLYRLVPVPKGLYN